MRRSHRLRIVSLILSILALPPVARPAGVTIRPDRTLEVDGEPFFPLGLLGLGSPQYEDWNERIRRCRANVVWDYEIAYADTTPTCRAVVDSARAAGYRLLVGSFDTLWWDDPATPEFEVDLPMYDDDALDALVACLDREPSVLLGFANRDEPVWTIAQGWVDGIDSAHVHDTYRQIHARVDSTVVAMNFAPVNLSGDFATWKAQILPYLAATDVVQHAAYPYPAGEGTCGPLNVLGWPECSMDRLADNADLFLAEINRPDQPLWMILQAFKGVPLREARWAAYASVVHRATGIFWAGWTWVHPLGDGSASWPVTEAVISEMSALHDFLVGEDLDGAEAGPPDVEVRVKRHRRADEAVAFAISRHGYRGPGAIRLPDLSSPSGIVTVVGEDRELAAVDGWIVDAFEAYEAHGYRYEVLPESSGGPTARFPLLAFPSPTRDATTLRFTLPSEAHVVFTVYDAAGRRVAGAGEGTFPAGPSELIWNGRDAGGRLVPPGVYFLRGESADGLRATARILVRR
jgi:hypothetical protein